MTMNEMPDLNRFFGVGGVNEFLSFSWLFPRAIFHWPSDLYKAMTQSKSLRDVLFLIYGHDVIYERTNRNKAEFWFPFEEAKEMAKEELKEVVKAEVMEEVKSEVREEIKSEMREEVKSIVINQVIKKVKKSKTLEIIASELEEEEADIKPIYDAVVSSAPDYDINVIKDRLDNM